MKPRTQAEAIRRAQILPPDQLVIEALHPSPITGVPLLTPDSLRWLRKLCPLCGRRITGRCARCAEEVAE